MLHKLFKGRNRKKGVEALDFLVQMCVNESYSPVELKLLTLSVSEEIFKPANMSTGLSIQLFNYWVKVRPEKDELMSLDVDGFRSLTEEQLLSLPDKYWNLIRKNAAPSYFAELFPGDIHDFLTKFYDRPSFKLLQFINEPLFESEL